MIKDFSPIRNLSKSTEVFEKLRSAILTGELQPGTPLKEAHLAKQMEVSQVPVREALFRLEHLGLVVRVQDRGTHVTNLSREDILELMQVRAQLEELAFRLASKRLTPEIETELNLRLKELEESTKSKSHVEVGEADLRFHEVVWKASGNRVLEQSLDQLCVSLYAFVSLKRQEAGEKLATVSHRDLVKALKSGDARIIARQIREHLRPESVIPSSVNNRGER